MAKPKEKSEKTPSKPPSNPPLTLALLNTHPHLSFRTLLLIHDLTHLAHSPLSAARLAQTTDPLYISGPYFTTAEATAVKTAILDASTNLTLEAALHARLENFREKRRASGDWRPCGPHDLAPLFREALGVGKEVVEGRAFLARLRRERLG